MEVVHNVDGYVDVYHSKYALDILNKNSMSNYKPCKTLV